MKTPRIALLSLAALATAALALPAQATPARDEALARRLLFCANVAQFWAESLRRDGDTAHVTEQLKIRDLFVIAAEYVTEPEFATKAQPAAILSVRTLLSRQQAEQRDLMSPETQACTTVFKQQAQPLLQQRALEVQAAAAAASAASAAGPAR